MVLLLVAVLPDTADLEPQEVGNLITFIDLFPKSWWHVTPSITGRLMR